MVNGSFKSKLRIYAGNPLQQVIKSNCTVARFKRAHKTYFLFELLTCNILVKFISFMKEMLNEVRCLKSSEDMIRALAGQFKQLSHEPEKLR